MACFRSADHIYSSHALQYKEHLIKFVSNHSENKRCGICTLNITINSTPIWTWKRVVAIFSEETDFSYNCKNRFFLQSMGSLCLTKSTKLSDSKFY